MTGGPLAGHYQRTHAHFLKLDEDRILKVYRQRAGLPAPGADMGGWYDAEGFVPGHLIGQFISGLSRIHATTGDPLAAAKARRLVEGYAAAFEKDGNPYASPKASTTWPCYILDKYEIGLLDAANLAGIPEARALLPRVIQARRPSSRTTLDRTPDSPRPGALRRAIHPAREPLQDLRTDRRQEVPGHGQAVPARQRVLQPARRGRQHSAGEARVQPHDCAEFGGKGVSHARRREIPARHPERRDMLEQTQQYASGGSAPKEAFVKPHSGELAASLISTRDHFEAPCGYYAHSRLARYLMSFTGDARYGDGLERLLFNTVLGAIEPDDTGGYFYYSDYQAQGA